MKVSVITPMYNCESFISETIDSVLNQTYEDWEMIIIDDCSTDRSVDIVNKYIVKDKRIKLIKLEENSGAAIARNKGMEISTGRFIAFLDGDDLWEPEKLEIQIKFMTENNVGFSFTSYKVVDENNINLNRDVRVPKSICYDELLKNTIIGCLTVMIDKNIIGDFKMPPIRTRQDFATWLSILKKGHIAYGIDCTLSKYRLVKGSISHNKFKAAKRNWYVYRKIENISLLKSMYVFIHYVFNAIKKRVNTNKGYEIIDKEVSNF